MFRQFIRSAGARTSRWAPTFALSFLSFAILSGSIGLGGCGNSCYAGFSINGNGGVIVKAGDPPSTCSLSPAPATLRVTALKSPVCETCAGASRAGHVYVVLKGIQLRTESTNTANSSSWLELAPDLATAPRQIDLMGDSNPEALVSGKVVPAGNYRELRLQFYAGASPEPVILPKENHCGEGGWNCLVTDDDHVESLALPGNPPELRIPLSDSTSDALFLLPESTVELRLSLLPQPVFSASGTEGWKLQMGLVGRAAAVREWSSAVQGTSSH